MNACDEEERDAERAAEDGMRQHDAAPCLTIGATCDGPNVPAVSSDCGINSPVLRQWATRAPGTGAPWGLGQTLREVCCDDAGCAGGEDEGPPKAG